MFGKNDKKIQNLPFFLMLKKKFKWLYFREFLIFFYISKNVLLKILLATFLPNFRANEEERLFEIYYLFSRVFNFSHASGPIAFLTTAIDSIPFDITMQDINA